MSTAHRRTRLATGLTLVAAAVAACGSSAGDPSKTLEVTMWGGSAQRAHVDTYIKPWAEANGLTVSEDSPTDYAKIKAQVDSKNVTWGVTEVEPNFSETACASGVLTKLTPEVKQAATDAGINPGYINDCAIPNLSYAFTIAYNTDTFADNHPKTWAEFFDTQLFPGKRGFWKYATGGMFEAALLADGVPADQLYPLDLDRAFRKLDTIKQDIVFYETGDEQAQLVASGEAPLVQAWNGRIYHAAKEGQPVANEWGQNLVSYDQVVIPAGYPNTDLAMKWMTAFVGDVQGQAADAEASAYDPINPKAMELVDPEVAKELATFPANQAQAATTMNYKYWAENYNTATERLNAWALS
ncbi:ABC transporter substrate-binding protein [Rhodococcus sp. ABRD24]|uniref:ABC transporter substrate-binding protein n=1 Tax=Rhodococcus sp. ABRD24 TaxID=2507582 RepID=UPI00103A025F|nr:ABC transporter substrate-binding protein [Rhodococcus sp. ABRD24]QBJ96301.1 ABC transporter substrate-binding protein [Rhodococcus sp. ABRD24]